MGLQKLVIDYSDDEEHDKELLHKLVEYAVPLDESKFTSLGAYEEPLRSTREIYVREREKELEKEKQDRCITSNDGVIMGLNLPGQVKLLSLLSEKYGIPLRHGSLKENLNATFSPNGQTYRKNLLANSRVYTGEMIIKSGNTSEIRRIKKVGSVPKDGVPKDHTIQPSGIPGMVYILGPVLQRQIPTKSGHFDKISGVIPINSEIRPDRSFMRNGTPKGNGFWEGMFFPDENGLAAVFCGGESYVDPGLYASADYPLDPVAGRLYPFVSGIWRDKS